jgi:uncharacterized protein (DUF1810 family)
LRSESSRLDRFRDAQDAPHSGFEAALAEIVRGGKTGHWIWYVFPQIGGLGVSPLSQTFAIEGEEEAADFLRDEELRSRLLTITNAVAEQLKAGTPLRRLMGSDIDARKVVSSLTLFGHTARRLAATGDERHYATLAAAADDVLATAESQGYPRCAFTLQRLREPPILR